MGNQHSATKRAREHALRERRERKQQKKQAAREAKLAKAEPDRPAADELPSDE
jgi:hypothetical protein